MPNFGDYETVGEPLAVINLQGHSSTIWKVQKPGSPAGAGLQWVAKCYSPHRKPQAGGDEASLHRDRGLEFLEGIKQLKKVLSEGGRHLTPIHDLGISPDGVWYVTDYFPRGSLQALIGRRAKVDGAALKQITRCIVAGCLLLKRSRGYPHGNLKASNVFLVGKPQTLPKTPMVLADPYPAAPLKLAQLDAADRLEVNALLYQVMEVQDLHALGEIILQLVERRQIRSGYDYNYPISRSELWDNLGKDGESWRQICNQLLDPRLSLAETNFESLAKRFPAPASGNGRLVATSVVLAIGLAGGGYYGYSVYHQKRQQENFNNSLALARQALDSTNFHEAAQKIAYALKLEPENRDALAVSNQIAVQMEASYFSSIAKAGGEFTNSQLTEASNDLVNALDLNPEGVEANDLMAKLQAAQTQAGQAMARQQQYDSALKQGQADFASGDYAGASKQAAAAQALPVSDTSAARKLQAAAEEQLGILEQTRQQYQSEMQTAQASYDQGDYGAAVKAAEAALASRRHDPAATALKTEAQDKLDELRHAQEAYDAAVKQGQSDLASGDYAGAGKQAAVALALQGVDTSAAKQLQADAAAKLGRLQQVQQQYDAAVRQGQAELAGGDYAGAAKQAAAALGLPVADTSAAQQLQSDAAAKLGRLQQAQQQYDAAVRQGQAELASGDYAEAAKQAATALALPVADPSAAKQLQSDAAAKLEALRQAQQEYDAAVRQGQAELAGGDYAGAARQAAAALALPVADPSAAKNLQAAAAAKLEALRQAQQQYDAAVKQGQAELASGDYAGAAKQAAAALALPAADTSSARQLQADATAKLEALRQAQAQYDTAVRQGEAELAGGDYAGASKQAATALAMNVPDTSAAGKLKAQADEAIIEASDFQAAENSLTDCAYQSALDTCSKHAGVSKFDDLRTAISAQQGDFEKATKELNAGNYSFIQAVQNDYGTNACFKDLLAQANAENQVFQSLEKLTNALSNWTQVKNILNDQSKAGITQKDGFQQFRDWAAQNDPQKILAARLDVQLSLFEVWFGIKNPEASIKDPSNNNQPAAKLPPGVIPESYYTVLNSLKAGYLNLGGDQSSHLNAIANIKDKMDNWDQ